MMVADRTELRTLVAGTPAQPFLEEHNSPHVRLDSLGASAGDRRPSNTSPSKRARLSRSAAWVADHRPGVLFMPYRAGQIAALRSTISAWMRLAIFEAMDAREQSAPGAVRDSATALVRGR